MGNKDKVHLTMFVPGFWVLENSNTLSLTAVDLWVRKILEETLDRTVLPEALRDMRHFIRLVL